MIIHVHGQCKQYAVTIHSLAADNPIGIVIRVGYVYVARGISTPPRDYDIRKPSLASTYFPRDLSE